MIINPQVPLNRLVLSLSEALDSIHPQVADHQQRVAYIATSMARQMGFAREDLINTFHAAALHDIGLTGAENRYKVLALGQLEAAEWHSEVGHELLKSNPLFAPAAAIVRYHHARWEDGRGSEHNGQAVPLASHVLSLADSAERMIHRQANILEQQEAILERVAGLSAKAFHPRCVEALREVGRAESFWLDAVSPRIYGVLLRQIDWPTLVLDEQAVGPIAATFGRIVDLASNWTMVHSAGVTASAVELARRLDFSPRELHLMRAAGHLHDLGKLTVPASILDKPGKLTPQEMAVMRSHTYHTFRVLDTIGGMPQISEWAAFHHERLDGTGYPFHHAGRDLTLGSRIMSVADVFTAVAEDRPYRKGMTPPETLAVLDKLASDGALDGEVVEVIRRNYEAVDQVRREEQAAYAREQETLTRFLRMQQVSPSSGDRFASC